ncbi:MAG: hypothetical protein JW763_02595 [candidate division Zixibacteria bacterium]|nr:hypothetical protein [candidate division Zixibacteria bacterium]
MKYSFLPALIVLVGLGLLATTCSNDPASSKKKPTPTVVELLATDENGLEIAFTDGQTIEISVTDTVSTNPNGLVEDCDLWTDADGIADCQYVTSAPECRGLPFMALIGKTGSIYFLVGTSYSTTFTGDGTLTLEINDWEFYDNAGKFVISYTLE